MWEPAHWGGAQLSTTGYTVLWTVYGVASLLGFLLLWRMTRWQSGATGFLAGLIRLLFAVIMLTPAALSTEPDYIAPAFVVTMFDYFQGFDEGAFDAAINLGVAIVAATILYCLVALPWWFLRRRAR